MKHSIKNKAWLKIITIFFLLLSFNALAGDTIENRIEMKALMEKIISQDIRNGNFQHKGYVTYISHGMNGDGINVGDPGNDRIKFNSVIGTFVYVRWNNCEGVYLTKNSLGKMRTCYNYLRNREGFKKHDDNTAYAGTRCLEYVDGEKPYIICYEVDVKDLPNL